MRVLYIGGVGPFGGASRSLFEAVGALPDGAVQSYFLMPRGTAMDFYRRVAKDTLATVGISRFDHTRATYYRGFRWVVLARECVYIVPTIFGLLKARRRWRDIDIVHVNEITEVIPAIFAKMIFGAKLVVHVRSLVETNRGLWRTRLLHRALRRHADAVVAIDETVRATLPDDLPVTVIHNSFTPSPIEQPDEAYLNKLATLRPTSLKVGFVGNLLRIKGVSELIYAARVVRDRGGDVQILLVGGALVKSSGIKSRLLSLIGVSQDAGDDSRTLVERFGLQDDVLLLGPTRDIQRVYPKIDVLAFPSHFDAPGRPVFEAAFFGVPSIVAVRDPTPDTLVHNETGLAIAKPDPELLADAIMTFADNRSELLRMGRNAKALAERNFVPKTNSAILLALYKGLMERRNTPRRG